MPTVYSQGIHRSKRETLPTKLVLAHHMGRRTHPDASAFLGKLALAARGAEGKNGSEQKWQISTDGWNGYPDAIDWHLGGRVDYGQAIKTFGGTGLDNERRYSPPTIIGIEKIAVQGEPEEKRVCTSHAERTNLHVRMQMRRFTRLTNAFSRKRENLRAALALHFAAYNFTWMHSSLRMTPAMKAGIARRPWSVRDLLTA